MQRFFDILISGAAIAVLSPFLVPLVLVLRLTGEGEIFFTQQRIGRTARPFSLYKFATMLKARPSLGTGTVTVKDDPRILPVGRFLRATKINELPQIINVLKGDMSVIGPRPQERRCFDAFPAEAREAIVQVRPGLSGVGSILFRNEQEMMDGERDPDRVYDEIIMPYKARLEEWYVENRSLALYFQLIFLTVWAVLFARSALPGKMLRGLPEPDRETARVLEKGRPTAGSGRADARPGNKPSQGVEN